MSTLGTAIATSRRRAGYTQTWLAEQLGVTQPSVSDWEKGVSQPSLETIGRIEELLGIPKGQLLVDGGLVDVQLIGQRTFDGRQVTEAQRRALEALFASWGDD